MPMAADLINAFSRLAGRIDGEVYRDDLRRCMLATDASIFQVMPLAVVYPRTTADVVKTVRFADRRRISLHPRGAGSGLCGSAVGEGIVLDFSKFMHRLLRLNLEEGWFECQPGYRLGELEAALAGGCLFFPPDPSSGEYATFGGMTNTNASGAHSVKYGNVADYFLDAEVVLADGAVCTLSQVASMPVAELPENLQHLVDLYRSNADAIETAYPPIACNVAGYNLRGLVDDSRLRLHRLLAGAEGTLAIITRLKFRLIPKPAADALAVAYFDDIVQAAKAVQLTMPLGPAGIEIMDKSLLDLARASDATLRERIPEGVDNVLLIEFDGQSTQDCARLVDETQRRLLSRNLARSIHPAASTGEKEKFWALRKAAVPILYRLKGEKKILALVEDAAIPVDRLVDYFDGIYRIFERHDVQFVLYGHIAKGLMHTRPLLNLKDARDCALLKPIADAVYELVERLGGTVSGEHGDGRLRSAYLRRTYGDVYALFERVKALLDPRGLLNPGIKQAGDPEQMSRYLRLGPAYRSEPPKQLQLVWPSSFVAETEKCHGCTKCTTITTATRMCPVYKVTRDETAAPKAKANVLRALISGVLEQDAIYQSGLQQVMAQCINCGSCFKECPSNVNIPKLAMEAKAIYVRRFGSPVSEKLTANVEAAAKTFHPFMALLAPALRSPLVHGFAARLGGLAPEREMVAFARRQLYRRVSSRIQGSGPSVLYYAGCYAGYIRPELGEAAIEVLTRAGFDVHLPPQSCCGLPHLSKGMVTTARRKVMENLRSWQKSLDGIDHIVVSCSSCGFALMKDWGCLIPDQEMAERISAKTVHICHLLNRSMDRLELRKIPMKVAYHQPCHLRIQPDSDSSLALLSAVPGVDPYDLKSHCCGMAGSWGLLARNYATSRSIGTPLIEKLNSSGAQCGVTDCPTCQLQMEHMGNLPVRHPVEIVRSAMRQP